MFDILEAKKETMMDTAVDCFTKANKVNKIKSQYNNVLLTINEINLILISLKVWYSIGETVGLQDERWLHQYMLGKVAEKRDRDRHSYLQHYCKVQIY